MGFKKTVLVFLFAFTLTVAQATGIRVPFEYEEPTTDMDGSTLTDLAKIVIYYDIVEDSITTPTKLLEVPATQPTGGGHVKKTVVVPLTKNKMVTVDFHAVAVDTSGNESQKSNVVRKFLGYVSY